MNYSLYEEKAFPQKIHLYQRKVDSILYAATLAAQAFRALVTIAAAFDLEMFQWDMVNVFVNSSMEETVYCDCSESFEKTEKCLLLL